MPARGSAASSGGVARDARPGLSRRGSRWVRYRPRLRRALRQGVEGRAPAGYPSRRVAGAPVPARCLAVAPPQCARAMRPERWQPWILGEVASSGGYCQALPLKGGGWRMRAEG